MGAMFQLTGGGVGVMPDGADNDGNHQVPHHESGLKITFEVVNVGDAGGNAKVGVELDDSFMKEWQSSFLDPGGQQAGSASLGRVSSGDHTVLIYVNPGSGSADHEENTFNVA
jgi:hypothetical protein